MSSIIIDVRKPAEYQAGHVTDAINVPSPDILSGKEQLTDYPKKSKIVLYCRNGARAGFCKDVLDSYGFKHVTNGIDQANVEAKFI